ncbi:MAG: iron ABC transporter permease [Elusimicrobiales bacterium]
MANKNSLLPWLLPPAVAALAAAAVFIGPVSNPDAQILLAIRLPRVLAGLIAGAALAGAGALMQGVMRNPLADPYILGTSSGAALGAVCALVMGAGYGSPAFYAAAALGGFAATAAAYLLARGPGRTPTVNLLLSGVVVSSFCGAAILLFFSLRRSESFSALMFMMGSITETTPAVLATAAALFAAGAAGALLMSRRIDIMSMGPEKAQSLGVNTERLKLSAIIAGSLMCAAAVGLSGTVGFAGLIVPHAARLIAGPSQRRMTAASLFIGAGFLVVMDSLARSLAAPRELPVGALTAMTGAPFFLWLLNRRGNHV